MIEFIGLIIDEPDPIGVINDGSYGFGFMITKDEKTYRCGVRVPKEKVSEEIIKAWKMLSNAIAEPEKSKFKAAIGEDEILAGNEMKLEDYDNIIKIEKK